MIRKRGCASLHIIPNLDPIPLNKPTTGDIQQFYTELKQNGRLPRQEQYGEGLSGQTVRGIYTTLRSALAKAAEEKLIIRNPADNCRLPSAKAREMQVLSPEEIQRLLKMRLPLSDSSSNLRHESPKEEKRCSRQGIGNTASFCLWCFMWSTKIRKTVFARKIAKGKRKAPKIRRFLAVFVRLYHCRFLNPRLKNAMCKSEVSALFQFF